MTDDASAGRRPIDVAAAVAGRLARASSTAVTAALGGRERTRVILLLASVLALASADSATVGASAIQLRHDLHINNTDVGLLVTVTSLVAAAASLPFGVLADRVRRTRLLGGAIVLWGAAMLWSATAPTFGQLLLARLFLGGGRANRRVTRRRLVRLRRAGAHLRLHHLRRARRRRLRLRGNG